MVGAQIPEWWTIIIVIPDSGDIRRAKVALSHVEFHSWNPDGCAACLSTKMPCFSMGG